ncbi:MAG: phosphatase PAP2 family protein [Nitrospirae bacterium]|nr:phosphatase PAP2 family protein [Nitrospirota bacterium]
MSNYKTNLVNIILLVYPIVFLAGIFETFFMTLPYFNAIQYDDLLMRIDYSMFGTAPTVWIDRFVSPVLTELMYALYLFYFPMPIILMYWIYRQRKFREIEQGFFIYLSCYYLAYIIYFIVPANGPRFHLDGIETIPLNGYILTEPIRELINILEPNKFDAFPSLHSGILLTTMIMSYRFARGMFYIFIPIAIGIMVSLVYCRYHYVIDIIAGLIVAVISYQFSSRIYEKTHNKTIFHFKQDI